MKPAPTRLLVNRFGMRFVRLPAGHFRMGADAGERETAFALVRDRAGVSKPERYEDEGPPHEVRIPRPLFIGQYEVTQAQWQAVMQANPSADAACGPGCPVENISWNDAVQFCAELRRLDPAQAYRLPTEAEWEYAARAGAGSLALDDAGAMGWYAGNSGDRPIDALAVWRDDPQRYGEAIKSNHSRIHPVGTKAANRAGLFDMLGNVWEWVADWYDPGYYARSPVEDPRGPASGAERVLRGGSYDHNSLANASVLRVKFAPDGRAPSFGVRLVISPGSAAAAQDDEVTRREACSR